MNEHKNDKPPPPPQKADDTLQFKEGCYRPVDDYDDDDENKRDETRTTIVWHRPDGVCRQKGMKWFPHFLEQILEYLLRRE